MRSFLTVSLVALLLVAVSIVVGGDRTASAQEVVTVSMAATTGPDGGGDQTGSVTLTAMDTQTVVVVSIDPSPDGATVEQPGHVHAGTCATLGGVEYPLTNIVNGASTTTIDATLASLQTGAFSINIHKSGAEIGVYASCGDIPASTPDGVPTTGGDPGTTNSGLPTLTYAFIALGAVVAAGGAATMVMARRPN